MRVICQWNKKMISYRPLINMEITGKTILFAIISVLIIAIILSGIFYLMKSSKQIIPTGNKNPDPLARLGVITNNPQQPVVSTQAVAATNTKTYQGRNFTINYPQKWGILTCSDSDNIEFDPYSGSDLKNYACDRAIKPITVLVSSTALSCPGESIKIGNNTVIKSRTETAYWLKNRWCLNKSGLSFDITNRVNQSGIVGTGKDDFSSEIEKIINSL